VDHGPGAERQRRLFNGRLKVIPQPILNFFTFLVVAACNVGISLASDLM
jgi:hypothetical protein